MTFKSTRKALLATAVSSAMLAGAQSALAADLDSLSDDDLLARIEALEKAIEGKGNVVLNGNKKIKVVVNGQINNAVRYSNNGEDQALQIVDNDASSNRFRILGSGKLNDRFSVKTAFEFDLEVNPRDELDVDDDTNLSEQVSTDANFEIRKAEAIFVDKLLGSIFLGQGDTASNKSAESDLSGATLAVGDASFDDDGIDIVDAAGTIITDVGDVFDPIDGLSRESRIRYETPSLLGGFKASASYVSERQYDAALTYSNKNVGDFSIKGAAAYFAFFDTAAIDPTTNQQSRGFTGSLSALHKPTGLSLTGGYHNFFDDASAPDAADNFTAWWIKGGWQGKLTSLGKTAFAVDYMNINGSPEGDDVTNVGSGAAELADAAIILNQIEGFSVGVQLVQKIDKLSTEAFVGYRLFNLDTAFELDETGGAGVAGNAVGDPESVHIVAAGARVKF
ncbi:MAG: hypothetical protein AAGE61_18910 [Pseudomonadota bacterium]